jgi:hypothetical protein
MRSSIRIRTDRLQGAAPQKAPGFLIRPLSFVASVGLHCIAVVILGLIPGHYRVPEKSMYDDLIRPQAHKIIWYDFRERLPNVAPAKRVGTFPKPRGTEVSKRAMIAMPPSANSDKQFIWQPFPKIEIPHDLPLPNLIARAIAALPAPPTEEKKTLELPDLKGKRSAPQNSSSPEPDGDLNRAPKSPNDGILLSKPRKAFVPPPQVTQQARLSTPALILDAPMPDTSIFGSPKTNSALLVGLGVPAVSKGSAPPLNAPAAAIPNTGNAKVDIAIVGLNAPDKLNGPLPEGTRAGRFSKAPTEGDGATGDVTGSAALTVPNLSIREGRSGSAGAPEIHANRRSILYAEKLRSLPISTLSAPLRPASRTIPKAIDAQFQGRNVYTMVIPIENLPAYGGDWIVWFAERDPRPGGTPLMRAPLPFRKLEPVEVTPSVNRMEQRLQFVTIIKQDGRLHGILLLTTAGPAVSQAVIQDLASWEFKPATRDGMPVDVDVVIEVPFNWIPEVAKARP